MSCPDYKQIDANLQWARPLQVDKKNWKIGWEPWSSGYWKRLTFQRSWVRIPAPYTGWTFFHINLW